MKRFAVGGAVAVYLALAVAAGAQTRATATPQKEVRRAAVEEMRAKFEAAKKEAQTKMQAARTDFQAKLKQIKDGKKQQAADNLYERLGMLNAKWAEHFGNVLEKYDATLKKVESRRDKAQTAGRDVAVVNAAFQAATAMIESARAAVEAQTKKTYSVAVTTEAKLREAFQAAHKALKTDLMALRDGAMRSAREAVQKAIQSLRAIPNVDSARTTATSSQQ